MNTLWRSQRSCPRVVFDSSVLLGSARSLIIAGAALRYYNVYWSSWLISEFVRKRTEWIAQRAIKDGCSPAELRQRQRESRERVDAAVAAMSHVFHLVDYTKAASVDVSWLGDTNDRPVMQTALAARAAALITENSRDFPLGQTRDGIMLANTEQFLATLYTRFPDAETQIQLYIGQR